jgi:hypothetical protein
MGLELAIDVKFESLVLAAVALLAVERLLAKKLSSCFFWLIIKI